MKTILSEMGGCGHEKEHSLQNMLIKPASMFGHIWLIYDNFDTMLNSLLYNLPLELKLFNILKSITMFY